MEDNNVYFFREGKETSRGTSYISYTDVGKVIIGKNCNKPGFYKLKNAQERPSCIIADVERVVWDYYRGISCEELKSVFKSLGFKIAFEMPFVYKYRDWKENLCVSDELRIVAYNKDVNMIIVADTFNPRNSFDSVICYCYGVNGFSVHSRLLDSASYNQASFNIADASIGLSPLHMILDSYAYKSPYLDKGMDLAVPSGWTYADDPKTKEDFEAFRQDFLNRCPQELRDWFR